MWVWVILCVWTMTLPLLPIPILLVVLPMTLNREYFYTYLIDVNKIHKRLLLLNWISGLSAGVSEDSDYTSDVNYPVGQHPNSSASQFLSAAHQLQLITPERSLASSRENSYEKEEEYSMAQAHHYHSPTRTLPRRLPEPRAVSQGQSCGTDFKSYETDPLYYNSRPQPYKSYK
jgi:hypothetical protein